MNLVNVKYFKILNENVSGTDNDLYCKCHICGDSKKKNKKRLHLFNKNSDTDSIHCFNCGYSSSAFNYFKEFHPDIFTQYKRELRESIGVFNNTTLEDLVDIKKKETLSIESFNKYFKTITSKESDFLYSRGFKDSDIELMKIRQGKSEVDLFGKKLNLENFIVIPLINSKNEVFGFQARSILNKTFFTIVSKGYKCVWGENHLNYSMPIYLFESIFDAVSSGVENSLAVLGIGSGKALYENFQNFILCPDNQYKDETSLRVSKELSKSGYKVMLWKNVDCKDFNDLLRKGIPKEKIKEYILKNIDDPMKTYLRLNEI